MGAPVAAVPVMATGGDEPEPPPHALKTAEAITARAKFRFFIFISKIVFTIEL
jgi:hypothetical protein